MQKIISILFILLITSASVLEAQDVIFQGSAKNVVRIGQRFQLIYTLNAEGKNFQSPDIDNFKVLSSPSVSQSSSIQIINGSVSRTVEYSYTILLEAIEEGIFEIPPAEITVENKTYKSNPLKIQVVKGGSTQQNQQQNRSGNTNTITLDDLKDDLFVRAVVDKRTPIQGEQIVVTYKLYFRINISNPDYTKEPSFKGFWVNDLLKNAQRLPQYQENYKGKNYHVAELKKLALFPQRSGQIKIDPMELNVQAQVKSKTQKRTRDPFFDSFFNDPFFNRYQTVNVPLSSNGITLDIKPLPSSNKPADFNGAVGKFNLNSSIDKTELKANEAINYKITVSGTGNVELVDKVDVSFPPDFEVYDPKITKKINYANKVSGNKTFEYLIIPRTPGDFKIEPVKFTFYDLSKKKYISLTTPAYDIKVDKGDGSESDYVYSGVNQSDIRYIGTDIRHILVDDPGLKVMGLFFFGSTLFYVLLAVPLILFIFFVIFWKNELKKRSNIALMKNRKATKVATKRMKKAEHFMKENKKEEFYEEVSQALWGYLSDKFSIPLANLSIDTVNETLTEKEVNENTIKIFIETLNNCEFARFAPGDSNTTMEKIYNEGINIISHMERELR